MRCRGCEGVGSWMAPVYHNERVRETCPRCNGSGEEPASRSSRPAPKMRIVVQGREQCSECQGLGYAVQRDLNGLLMGKVCSVCRGDGDHPGVLVVPCVDVRR